MDTLSEVLIALLKNSVDAHSTSIAIRVCPELFWLQVLDNGDGFDELDLASVDKCCLLNIDFQQMKPTKMFARLTGSSLLDIIGRCEEVLIESLDCRHGASKTLSRNLKHPAASTRPPSPANDVTTQYSQRCTRKSQGTTVTLKNLFWQDHCRQADYGKLLVELRKFALVHFDRSFTLQNLSTAEVEFKSKKRPTFISKYCELYQLSQQNIDVTTCSKDNVCIECYFSRREARSKSFTDPVQFTFINGLASEAFLPTVTDILTQQKESLDFVLLATFPKHDVLTQLTEPIVRNCLLRCLNQYKKLLKDRKVAAATAAAAIVSPEQIPAAAVEDNRPDQEDILYGLRSQQPHDEENRKAVEKCSLWLRNNDFDVRPEPDHPPQPVAKRLPNERQGQAKGPPQPVDFFGTPLAPDSQAKFAVPLVVPSTPPRNKLPAKLPVPKFHHKPTPPRSPLMAGRQSRRKRPKRNAQRTPQRRWQIVEIKEKDSASAAAVSLESRDAKKHHNKHQDAKSFQAKVEIPTTLDPIIINQQSQHHVDRNKREHAINNNSPTIYREIPTPTRPVATQISGNTSFWRDFERTDAMMSQKDASFLNVWAEVGEGDIHTKRNESPVFQCDSNDSKSKSNASPRSILDNQNVMESEMSYIFPEPHFLGPRDSVPSPQSLWEGLDLPEQYEDFHEACHETIQHYRVAVTDSDRLADSKSGVGCRCNRSPSSREIEILRQPFLEPRNILRPLAAHHPR